MRIKKIVTAGNKLRKMYCRKCSFGLGGSYARQSFRITSESYPDDVGSEPLGADEAVREVEGHHEPHDESDGRSDARLVVDPVQPDSYRSPSPPRGGALIN